MKERLPIGWRLRVEGVYVPELNVWVLNGREVGDRLPIKPMKDKTRQYLLEQFDAAAKDYALISTALWEEDSQIQEDEEADPDQDPREREKVHLLLQQRVQHYREKLRRIARAFPDK